MQRKHTKHGAPPSPPSGRCLWWAPTPQVTFTSKSHVSYPCRGTPLLPQPGCISHTTAGGRSVSAQLSQNTCSVRQDSLVYMVRQDSLVYKCSAHSFFYVYGCLICMSGYASCVHAVSEKTSKRCWIP